LIVAREEKEGDEVGQKEEAKVRGESLEPCRE